jgi:hypothetical protein
MRRFAVNLERQVATKDLKVHVSKPVTKVLIIK